MNDYFPCELSIDAAFMLDTDPPSTVTFTIEGLSVAGPNC